MNSENHGFVVETDAVIYGVPLFIRWWRRPAHYDESRAVYWDCRFTLEEAKTLRDAIQVHGAASFQPRDILRVATRVILAEPEMYPGEFMEPAYYDGDYDETTANRLWWPYLAEDRDLEDDLLGFKVFAQYDADILQVIESFHGKPDSVCKK